MFLSNKKRRVVGISKIQSSAAKSNHLSFESLENRRLLAITADINFANGGRFAFGDGVSLTALGDSAVQSDGKIVVGGTYRGTTGADPGDMVVERYNSDGTLDRSFGTDGRTMIDIGFDETVYDVHVTSSDEIIVVGDSGRFSIDGFVSDFALARLSTDGTVQATSPVSLSGVRRMYHSILDSAGQIVLAGDVDGQLVLAKYSQGLRLVTTFGEAGIAPVGTGQFVNDMVEAGPGYVMAVNSFELRSDFVLVGVDTAGNIAPEFGTNGIATYDNSENSKGGVSALGRAPDGSILVAGSDRGAGIGTPLTVARFDSMGTLASGFGAGGIASVSNPNAWLLATDIAVQSDGSFVLAGGARTQNSRHRFFMAQFEPNGSLNSSFGNNGQWASDTIAHAITELHALSPTEFIASGGDGAWANVARIIDTDVASIGGRKWQDINGNDAFDAGEGIAGANVYVDVNHSGTREFSEPSAFTDPEGRYLITDIQVGTHAIRSDQARRFVGPDASFGFSLDIRDDYLMVGAPEAERRGELNGAAYLYDLRTNRRNELDPGVLAQTNLQAYGSSVLLAPNNAYVGSPLAGAGKVAQFSLSQVQPPILRRVVENPHPGDARFGTWIRHDDSVIPAIVSDKHISVVGVGSSDAPSDVDCILVAAASRYAGCLSERGDLRPWSGLLGPNGARFPTPQEGAAYGVWIESNANLGDSVFVGAPLFQAGIPSQQGIVDLYEYDNPTDEFSITRIPNPDLGGRFGITIHHQGDQLFVGNGNDAVAIYDSGILVEVLRKPRLEPASAKFGFTVEGHPSSGFLAVSSQGNPFGDPGEVHLIPKASYVTLGVQGVSDADFYTTSLDIDQDGIPDSVESTAPNYGDGNDDGVADALQGFVLTLERNGVTFTVDPLGRELTNVQITEPTDPLPIGIEFPFGQLSFSTSALSTGDSIDVNLIVHEWQSIGRYSGYYKLHPTMGWYELPAPVLCCNGSGSATITLHLTDGDEFGGDFDLQANGIIIDPGGIGVFSNDFDLNDDESIDASDIDHLCERIRSGSDDQEFDLNGDGRINVEDHAFYATKLLAKPIGDANFDGAFSSSDLVSIFTANEFEDDIIGNSTWATGDWDCDGEFGTGDLVAAFRAGAYVAAARSQRFASDLEFDFETFLEPDDQKTTKSKRKRLSMHEPPQAVLTERRSVNLDVGRAFVP